MLWEDTKVGVRFGLGHHSAWRRCALATDVEWIVKAFHLFGLVARSKDAELTLPAVRSSGHASGHGAWFEAGPRDRSTS